MYRHFFKRLFDIIFSLVAIIILALPMFIIAVVVRCTSKGPAIFVQERVGKNGKPFKFYKFRSMTVDAPHDVATREINGDAYITKVGHFLRRTSLDELPQLFCILKGDMSLIGPRPVVCSETELTEKRRETGALAVRPGLTGLAQIRARDKLTDMDIKADVDGQYAQKITFWGDLKIFLKTILVVLREDGIEEGHAETAENAETAETTETSMPAVAEAAVEEAAVAEAVEETNTDNTDDTSETDDTNNETAGQA